MTARTIRCPDGREIEWTPAPPPPSTPPSLPRLCFAAAHVVVRPDAANETRPEAIRDAIDFDATMAIRKHLAAHGFGVAEAMDTAQRFEIGWPAARRLIEECGKLDLPRGFVAGAGSDQLDDSSASRSARIDAIAEQVTWIQHHGGVAVLLPQPWLCAETTCADDWVAFYRAIIDQVDGPLVVHWLGEMFHPGMRGAFPKDSFRRVMAIDPNRVRGCKLSLLDAEFEVEIRRVLAADGQIVLTGDDFHFGELLVGDGTGHGNSTTRFGSETIPFGAGFSHALLGILTAVAGPASRALLALADGDLATCRDTFSRCEAVGRVIFEPPTAAYKAGIALLAWLQGWQDHYALPFGAHRNRDLDHVYRVVAAAAGAGVFTDPELTADRLSQLPRTN